jgi:hypothetical protein
MPCPRGNSSVLIEPRSEHQEARVGEQRAQARKQRHSAHAHQLELGDDDAKLIVLGEREGLFPGSGDDRAIPLPAQEPCKCIAHLRLTMDQ